MDKILTTEQKREVLVQARQDYLLKVGKGDYEGLCIILYLSLRKYLSQRGLYVKDFGVSAFYDIHNIFPEFNRHNMRAQYQISPYWWDINDVESRLQALDNLIKVYPQIFNNK